MPWEYPNNVPNSVKHFKPSIQKKAISIANAVLRNGGSEGAAIAVGIKNAKRLATSNVKSFSKTASLNWAQDHADAQMNVLHQTQSMNSGITNSMLKRLRQPKSFKNNFSTIGNVGF